MLLILPNEVGLVVHASDAKPSHARREKLVLKVDHLEVLQVPDLGLTVALVCQELPLFLEEDKGVVVSAAGAW